MDLVQQIIARAKSNKQRIVLPEATEERTLKAADMVLADEVADIILIGNPDEINSLAEKWGLKHIGKATIVDPENNPKSEEYAALLAELRKKKGMTIEQARELVKNPLYLGCMIIKTDGADGQISGALSTTAETLRPALQIIKCEPGITCVSGAMLLITNKEQYGEDGILVVGDVAVTPVPDAQQLAQIAVCTAETAKSVAGFAEPRVAMLSFSTKGSASHEVVDKVVEATKLAKELAPDLKIDGEMQADAALVPEVGAKKAPGSESPRTMRTSIRMKRRGMRILLTRSMPFSTPQSTTAAVAVRNAAWHPIEETGSAAKASKADRIVDGSSATPRPRHASTR